MTLTLRANRSLTMYLMTRIFISALGGCCLRLFTMRSAAFAKRHVYIDLGANWANTLTLYQKHFPTMLTESWEIYAFEGSALISPYLEDFVAYLNGRKANRPSVPHFLPPSGSSKDLARFAVEQGCPPRPLPSMRRCMFGKLYSSLEKLSPRVELNDSELISSRLAMAHFASNRKVPRYTFIPVAVAASSGWLFPPKDRTSLIRGGLPFDRIKSSARKLDYSLGVRIIDWTEWLVKYFTAEDFIVVKMDIEGAEFEIFKSLLSSNQTGLIDVLMWECHKKYETRSLTCSGLARSLRLSGIRIYKEGEDYEGFTP